MEKPAFGWPAVHGMGVRAPSRPDWIGETALLNYLRVVNYDLDAPAKASLVLFAEHCRELGLIEAVPGLRFAL